MSDDGMEPSGHRPLDEILDDLDWVTSLLAHAEPDQNMDMFIDLQEQYILEMNAHPDTK